MIEALLVNGVEVANCKEPVDEIEVRHCFMDCDGAKQLREWLNAFLLESDKAAVLAKWSGAYIKRMLLDCMVIWDRINDIPIGPACSNEQLAWAAAAKLLEPKENE